MQSFDIEGGFWLEGAPDVEVPGRLTFDPARGAELRLLGQFEGSFPFSSSEGQPEVRIFGVGDGKIVTLLDCLTAYGGMTIPGILRQRFYPSAVLTGVHIESGQSTEFDSLSIQVNHLRNWVDRTGIRATWQDNGRFKVRYAPVAEETASIESGKLLMSVSPATSYSLNEINISEVAWLTIHFDEPKVFNELFGIADSIKNLISIATNTPASLTGIGITHADFKRDGKPKQIGVYVPSVGQETERDINPSHMLFGYSTIRGVQGIARWLGISSTYESAITSLLHHKYLPKLYEDMCFATVVMAAEGLAKKLFSQKDDPSLRDNLKSLVEYAGESFAAVGPVWAKDVSDFRNRILHGGSIKGTEGQQLYPLRESVYHLVVICLLKQMDVDDNALRSMRRLEIYRKT